MLLFIFATGASAAISTPPAQQPQQSEARTVMQGQLNAPPREDIQLIPEEAQVITQRYLQSIGKPLDKDSGPAGSDDRADAETRAQSPTPTNPNGIINVQNGTFMPSTGGGGYIDPHTGIFYAPAGPNGVVNTRTGEFVPVGH